MQNENVVLTDIQVQILEQEYERDETSGTIQRPIDINRLEALVKLMAMKEGEVSERAIDNWWYEKDLRESIKKRGPLTTHVVVMCIYDFYTAPKS